MTEEKIEEATDDNNNNSVEPRKLTQGEYRVGIRFNPAGNETVNLIKQLSAELMDVIESIQDGSNRENPEEVIRLKALAKDNIENGAMWAVKAATK